MAEEPKQLFARKQAVTQENWLKRSIPALGSAVLLLHECNITAGKEIIMGFLEDVLKIAIGAAVGSSLGSGQKQNKSSSSANQKLNLLGSSVCQYGKKDEHGFTQQWCMGCPVQDRCAQKK